MEGKWNQYKSMSAGSGTDPRNTKLLRHHCTLLFTMDIATQLYGSARLRLGGQNLGQQQRPAFGNIKALFQVRTDLNWTEQFTLGPVPFFLNVNPWVLAKLALAVGATRTVAARRFQEHFARLFQHVGLVHRQIGLAVTFGAGVAGVASSAIAWRRIPHTVHWVRESGRPPASAAARGRRRRYNVILQFVMFKWTTKAWSGSWPTLADSWNMSVNNGDQYVLQRSELALGGDTPYTLDARFGTPDNIEAGGVPQFIASAHHRHQRRAARTRRG